MSASLRRQGLAQMVGADDRVGLLPDAHGEKLGLGVGERHLGLVQALLQVFLEADVLEQLGIERLDFFLALVEIGGEAVALAGDGGDLGSAGGSLLALGGDLCRQAQQLVGKPGDLVLLPRMVAAQGGEVGFQALGASALGRGAQALGGDLDGQRLQPPPASRAASSLWRACSACSASRSAASPSARPCAEPVRSRSAAISAAVRSRSLWISAASERILASVSVAVCRCWSRSLVSAATSAARLSARWRLGGELLAFRGQFGGQLLGSGRARRRARASTPFSSVLRRSISAMRSCRSVCRACRLASRFSARWRSLASASRSAASSLVSWSRVAVRLASEAASC